MGEQQTNGNTVSRLTVHIVWSTKYRFAVLKGDIQKRCRKLLIEICDSEDIAILKGVLSNNHIHIQIEYLPSQDIITIVRKLKGRSSDVIDKKVGLFTLYFLSGQKGWFYFG